MSERSGRGEAEKCASPRKIDSCKKAGSMNREIDFTRGGIAGKLALFSIPLIASELLQNLYNSVDALVAGNLLDQSALAAVTVCGVIAETIISFFNGMSLGSNVVIAQKKGEGSQKNTAAVIREAFFFGILFGAILSVLGVLLAPQLLRLSGAQADYYEDALMYLRIYLAGIVFTAVYNNSSGILRAMGRPDIPMVILLLACVMNLLLDLLFVWALSLGIAGVGLATVIAQAFSAFLSYCAIDRISSLRHSIRESFTARGMLTVLEALKIGVTAGLQNAIIGFSNLFVMRYMNMFPSEAVAGIGIAQRLDKFIVLPAKSFGLTVTTYISQNRGAGEYRRIKKGVPVCMVMAVGVTLLLSVIAGLFAEQCVMWFSRDEQVTSAGAAMLRIYVPLFWTMAVKDVLVGVMRGCGRNLWPTLISLFGMVVVRQAFLSISMHNGPVIEAVYYCFPLTWAVTMLLLILYYYAGFKRSLLAEPGSAVAETMTSCLKKEER